MLIIYGSLHITFHCIWPQAKSSYFNVTNIYNLKNNRTFNRHPINIGQKQK